MAIYLDHWRQLDIIQGSKESLPAFVSAASGLLRIDDKFYVIDDESMSLAWFPAAANEGGQRYRLLDGELPLNSVDRKKIKPDLESICYLESAIFPPFGAILAVPSGSNTNRQRGALAVFVQPGILGQRAIPIDFTPIFQKLKLHVLDLNIEGCMVANGQLLLLQRGNGPAQQNAVIRLNLDLAVHAIQSFQSIEPSACVSVRHMVLGALGGVNLSFTDAACKNSQEVWFLAAAENTQSTYDDGQYCGAVLGAFNHNDEIIFQEELLCPEKPEGLCLLDGGDNPQFLVVTDADDPLKPASMYRGVRESYFGKK